MVQLSTAIANIRRIINEKNPSLWSDPDIIAFYQEGVRRIKNGSKLLEGLTIPINPQTDSCNIHDDFSDIPEIFAASRCYEQDKQWNESATKMNEFETKRLEYFDWLDQNPSQAILPVGKTYTDLEYQPDYVVDIYSDGDYGPIGDGFIIPDDE